MLTDVVEGYTDLASLLLERWSAHASKVADKLDAGTYDVDGVVADLTTTAALSAESGFLLASEALDAIAILTGRQRQPHIVDSVPFHTNSPGATLALADPLANGHKSDSLPTSVISIVPSALAANATEFRLRANATGRRSGIYAGLVNATTPGGVEPVRVWIIVS